MAQRAVVGRRGSLAVLTLAVALATGQPALARPGGNAKHGAPTRAAKPQKEKLQTAKPGHGKQPAASRHRTAQGVVQSITPKAIVLTQLDGSTVTVPINRHSRVFVNGKHARLAAVKPGFVLRVTWKPGKPAKVLRFLKPS